MIDALAKDIERALAAHRHHLADGPLTDAWRKAPAALRGAKSQSAVDALYAKLRDAGRFDSRDITAGAALAALNGLLSRINKATIAPAPEEAADDTKAKGKKSKSHEAP